MLTLKTAKDPIPTTSVYRRWHILTDQMPIDLERIFRENATVKKVAIEYDHGHILVERDNLNRGKE